MQHRIGQSKAEWSRAGQGMAGHGRALRSVRQDTGQIKNTAQEVEQGSVKRGGGHARAKGDVG